MLETSILSHLTNSALVVYALEFLKRTRWYRRFAAWLPIEEKKVHVCMSALGAAATGIGMHGAIEGSAVLGWHLSFTIPPLWVILHAAWDWGQQLALNQIVFALAVQQKQAAPVATVPIGDGATVTAPLTGKPLAGV